MTQCHNFDIKLRIDHRKKFCERRAYESVARRATDNLSWVISGKAMQKKKTRAFKG